MNGANFKESIVANSFFYGGDLRWSNFDSCMLSRAEFHGSKLFNSNFTGAYARSANFVNALLGTSNLDSLFGDVGTMLPLGLTRPPEWDERPNLEPSDPGNFDLTKDTAYQDWLRERDQKSADQPSE